jgi:hypothetical protein
MVGVVRIFIKNFSLCTHPLIKLTQKDEPFIFGPEQIQAQEDLKTADNPNTTQTLEYTKDKYNVKTIKQKVSPKVPPTTCIG